MQQSLVRRTLKRVGIEVMPRQVEEKSATFPNMFSSIFQSLFGFNRLSNTRINYAREIGDPLQNSLIRAAVNWVGRTLPEAPLQVLEQVKEGDESKTVPIDHPLVKLFKRPNKYYSGSTLAKGIALSWVINGNVYLWKIRNIQGEVIELWYLPHFVVEPMADLRDASVFISHYNYYVNGQTLQIPVEDIIHLRDGIDPLNPRRGLSQLGALLREIFSDIETINWMASLLKNGGGPAYVLIPKDGASMAGLSPEEKQAIKDEFKDKTTGDKRGEPLLAATGVTIEHLGFSPKDMDVSSWSDMPAERVASVIGIPAIVLGFRVGLEHATYSNMEQAERHAYKSYLVPLWRYIEEEYEHQILLSDYEKNNDEKDKPSRTVAHDLTQVTALQEDRNTLHTRNREDYLAGIYDRAMAKSTINIKPDDLDKGLYATRQAFGTSPSQGAVDESLPAGESRKPGATASDTSTPKKSVENGKPSESEIDAGVEWWEETAPKDAKDLINATVKSNGDGKVLNG